MPDDHPAIIAWEEYKKRHPNLIGITGPDALWCAYIEGWTDAMQTPNPVQTPTVREILNMDQRDALITAFTLLGLLKDMYNGSSTATGYRAGEIRKAIYTMLHGEAESREK